MKDQHFIHGFFHALLKGIEVDHLKPIGLSVSEESHEDIERGAIRLALNGQEFQIIIDAPCTCEERERSTTL